MALDHNRRVEISRILRAYSAGDAMKVIIEFVRDPQKLVAATGVPLEELGRFLEESLERVFVPPA